MHENCEAVNLFSPLIWKFKYQFQWDQIEDRVRQLISSVEENSKLEKGDAISTVSLPENLQPHTWLEFRDFQLRLGLAIDDIKKEYQFVNKKSQVIQSWINLHRSGGETIQHTHNAVTFAVAAYLKCPPGSGNIVFVDPLEYHKSNFPIYPEESGFKELPVETNDVIIFPGWLKHYVKPNQSGQERFVFTLNIK
jgi:uncharacterized protein (TIGR02466 family)